MSAEELSIDERKERVRAVVRAACRLADPRDRLGKEARRVLPGATGLSEEGVELALSRHLETSVSADHLGQLVASARSAPRVHVVLSANVFVGAVRAVALAVAAAPSVCVRPSSREAVLAPLLLRALEDEGRGVGFELTRELHSAPGDHVHVYGRRETIEAITAASPPGVRVRGHGPGFGVALVEPRTTDPKLAAERLSWDVVPFDQRGCLSPKIAIIDGSNDEAETLASALAEQLAEREREVPRGHLMDEERWAQSLYRQTMHVVGACYGDGPFAVGLDLEPRAFLLPPSGRCVHVVRASVRDELERLLAPFRGAITCIGSIFGSSPVSSLAGDLRALAPGARALPLGGMQCPPLDGPADSREML